MTLKKTALNLLKKHIMNLNALKKSKTGKTI